MIPIYIGVHQHPYMYLIEESKYKDIKFDRFEEGLDKKLQEIAQNIK